MEGEIWNGKVGRAVGERKSRKGNLGREKSGKGNLGRGIQEGESGKRNLGRGIKEREYRKGNQGMEIQKRNVRGGHFGRRNPWRCFLNPGRRPGIHLVTCKEAREAVISMEYCRPFLDVSEKKSRERTHDSGEARA